MEKIDGWMGEDEGSRGKEREDGRCMCVFFFFFFSFKITIAGMGWDRVVRN